MTAAILQHLKLHSAKDPFIIDRLIISAYLSINGICVSNNTLLLSYIISDCSSPNEVANLRIFLEILNIEGVSFDFEDLIELFEFVISPADKVVNGAIYTPSFIRSFIVNKLLADSMVPLDDILACDPACGCGGFLLTFSAAIHKLTNRSFAKIYREQLFGIDITDYSVTRTKLLLSLQALESGEDIDLDFNILLGNSLIFDLHNISETVASNGGFDIIVGNPPYVASRNMDDDTLAQTLQWTVSHSGHPDLYIPFFQIGYENLSAQGLLGFITVNTFIKSVNGRALRYYFQENDIALTLLNFGGEQLFKGRNTYTCICILKHGPGWIDYSRMSSDDLNTFEENNLKRFYYTDLDHLSGWNLVNSEKLAEFIRKIEHTGTPFGDIYDTKNGIATLKNDIYKFKPIEENELYYFLKDGDTIYPIEKQICRNIINANRIKTEAGLTDRQEKIIFPYDGVTRIFSEVAMQADFPCAYRYLLSKKKELATRDKGKREYEVWYAYGRRQSMDINAYKMFFSHICERPSFVICQDRELLFYNGIAVISDDLSELQLLKVIMESEIFYKYIRNTSKDYASGYISMSRNYIKNFGIFPFSAEQKQLLLKTNNPGSVLESIYSI